MRPRGGGASRHFDGGRLKATLRHPGQERALLDSEPLHQRSTTCDGLRCKTLQGTMRIASDLSMFMPTCNALFEHSACSTGNHLGGETTMVAAAVRREANDGYLARDHSVEPRHVAIQGQGGETDP